MVSNRPNGETNEGLADGGEIAFFVTTWPVEARWDCCLDGIAGTSFTTGVFPGGLLMLVGSEVLAAVEPERFADDDGLTASSPSA